MHADKEEETLDEWTPSEIGLLRQNSICCKVPGCPAIRIHINEFEIKQLYVEVQPDIWRFVSLSLMLLLKPWKAMHEIFFNIVIYAGLFLDTFLHVPI